MSRSGNPENFWEKNRIWIISVIAAVLAAGFITTVLVTMFCGGDELKTKYIYAEAKGTISIENNCYSSSYLSGDKFYFDKDIAEVKLLAKDPAIEDIINIDRLPKSEYGFLVNGEGDYIDNPSDIIMTSAVDKISVVSKLYRNLRADIPVNVVDGYIKEDELADSITIEAEDTKLYATDGHVLSDEEKRTLPTASGPYLSDESNKGGKCSGGACIRNLASGMKFEFEFVCGESATVNLEIKVCRRPNNEGQFDSWFTTSLNGVLIETGATIEAGPAGDYFTPDSFTIQIVAQKGLNVLTIAYGASPGNLDAVVLTYDGETKLFGSPDALVITTPETPDSGDEQAPADDVAETV